MPLRPPWLRRSCLDVLGREQLEINQTVLPMLPLFGLILLVQDQVLVLD